MRVIIINIVFLFNLLKYYELYVINIDACEKLRIFSTVNNNDSVISINKINVEQSTCKDKYLDAVILYYVLFFRMLFGVVIFFDKTILSKTGSIITFSLFKRSIYSSDIFLFIAHFLISKKDVYFRFFDKRHVLTDNSFSVRNSLVTFSAEHVFFLTYVDPEYHNFFKLSFSFCSYNNKSVYSDRILLSLFGVSFI